MKYEFECCKVLVQLSKAFFAFKLLNSEISLKFPFVLHLLMFYYRPHYWNYFKTRCRVFTFFIQFCWTLFKFFFWTDIHTRNFMTSFLKTISPCSLTYCQEFRRVMSLAESSPMPTRTVSKISASPFSHLWWPSLSVQSKVSISGTKSDISRSRLEKCCRFQLTNPLDSG